MLASASLRDQQNHKAMRELQSARQELLLDLDD